MRYLYILALVAGLAACSEDGSTDDGATEPGLDEEACEHHEEGPYADVTAVPAPLNAPLASIDHTSVRIALAEGFEGARGGFVSVRAADDADFVFFLTEAVPFALVEGDVEVSEEGSATCPEVVAASHIAELAVGTHVVKIGPTDAASVSLVFEEIAGEHGHHEDE
jgi:hypothetical protein